MNVIGWGVCKMIIQFSLEGRCIGLNNYQPATVVVRVPLAVHIQVHIFRLSTRLFPRIAYQELFPLKVGTSFRIRSNGGCCPINCEFRIFRHLIQYKYWRWLLAWEVNRIFCCTYIRPFSQSRKFTINQNIGRRFCRDSFFDFPTFIFHGYACLQIRTVSAK